MLKKILVAVDASSPSARAVEVAVELASQLGATIGIIHVADEARAYVPDLGIIDDVVMAELRRDGVQALDDARGHVPAGMRAERFLVEGDPPEAILATAEKWEADLIVIGSDSRGRLAHFLLGSTADSVIRKAPCPVVSVRAKSPGLAACAPAAAAVPAAQ